ncbi:MAG: hypothetical protein AAF493_07485 [Pseudomonadota bacterium]
MSMPSHTHPDRAVSGGVPFNALAGVMSPIAEAIADGMGRLLRWAPVALQGDGPANRINVCSSHLLRDIGVSQNEVVAQSFYSRPISELELYR